MPGYMKNKKPMGNSLKGKQAQIASAAEPRDKIDGKDFAVLRKNKKQPKKSRTSQAMGYA